MRIGELARQVGVSTDTVRFYERSGWLPRPSRRSNDYREYGPADAEHLRLLIDLRRLDMPLDEAARIASWCHAGHCAETTVELPRLIAERRAAIADRIAGLQELDARLGRLEVHLQPRSRQLQVLGEAACCDAAASVVSTSEGSCPCCAAPSVAGQGGRVLSPAGRTHSTPRKPDGRGARSSTTRSAVGNLAAAPRVPG